MKSPSEVWLKHGIRYRTSGLTTDDPTIGTCWDAHRLDIGRAGITPNARYMSTSAGKEMVELRHPGS